MIKPKKQNESWLTYHATLSDNHLVWFADYVELYPRAISADYSRLESEHDNILSAVGHAISGNYWQHLVRFGWAVCDPTKGYLRIRGYWSALSELLPQTIVAAQNASDDDALQTFRQHYANVKLDTGDWEAAEAIYHELLHYWRTMEDYYSVGIVMHQLGLLNQNIGRYEAAESWYRQSLTMQQSGMAPLPDVKAVKKAVQELAGDGGPREILPTTDVNRALFGWHAASKTVYGLGMIAFYQQDNETAYQLCQQSLAIGQAMGDELGLSKTYLLLGAIARRLGDLDGSKRLCEQSLALKQKLGDQSGMANALHQLGILAQISADYTKAESYYYESLRIDQYLGNPEGIAASYGQLANLFKEQNKLEQAKTLYCRAIALSRETGDKHKLPKRL